MSAMKRLFQLMAEKKASDIFLSVKSPINQSWGSGWGVRLLNRLVAEHYEK